MAIEDGVYIRFGADSAELQAAFKRTEAALGALSDKVKGTSAGLAPMTEATKRVVEQYDRAAVSLRKGGEAFQAVSEALEAGEISAQQATRTLEGVEKAARTSGVAGEHHAGIFREKMVLAHEAVMGSTTRMAGSMLVLAERTGSVSGALATLVTPTTLAAGGLVLATGSLVKLIASAEASERALKTVEAGLYAVGHGARFGAAAAQADIEQLARLPGVTREAAAGMEAMLARARLIGTALGGELRTNLGKSAALLGQEMPEALRTLTEALSHPAEGAKKLDDAYGILTEAQRREIETLMREGDLLGAQGVLWAAVKARLDEMPEPLTKGQQGAHDLAVSWRNLIGGLSETGPIRAAHDALADLAEGLAKDLAILNRPRVEGISIAPTPKPAKPAGDPARETRQANADLVRREGEATSNLLGPKERIRALDEQILGLRKAIAVADGKTAEDYRERIAIAEREKQTLLGEDRPKGQASQMQRWRAQLDEQRAASDASRAEELRAEIAFWARKASLAASGSAEAVEAAREESRARIELKKEERREAEKAAAARQAIAREDVKTDIEIQKLGLQSRKAALDQEVEAGRMTAGERIAAEMRIAETIFQLDARELEDEAKTLDSRGKAYADLYERLRLLAARHEAEMAKLADEEAKAQQKAARETQKAWEQALQPVGRAFNGMVSGVLAGTQTLSQAFARMGQNLVVSAVESGAQWVGKQALVRALDLAGFTETEGAKTAATAAGTATRAAVTAAGAAEGKAAEAVAGSASVLGSAYKAAAATYASVAEIPVIGPELAPVAAAAAFIAVSAFNIFSAERGWAQVPFDGALTTLHKNEMVLPASIASPLRAMTQAIPTSLPPGFGPFRFEPPSSPAGPAESGGAAPGGGDTYHLTIQAVDAPSFVALCKRNPDGIVSAMRGYLRDSGGSLRR